MYMYTTGTTIQTAAAAAAAAAASTHLLLLSLPLLLLACLTNSAHRIAKAQRVSQPDDSRVHAGCGSGCYQRCYCSSEITQASCHYSGGGGGCCSCASGNWGQREAADAPRPTIQHYRPPRCPTAPRGTALSAAVTGEQHDEWVRPQPPLRSPHDSRFCGCLTRSRVGRVRRALSVAVACDHDEHDYQSACLLCEHSEGVPQPHVAGLRS